MKGYTHTTRLIKRNKIITNNDVDRSPFPGKWQHRGAVNSMALGLDCYMKFQEGRSLSLSRALPFGTGRRQTILEEDPTTKTEK
jgi:hypothetical protein